MDLKVEMGIFSALYFIIGREEIACRI